MFKLIQGKHPINSTDDSIFFNTTEDVKINLANTPKYIASNNQKLTTAQATSSTIDKSVYLKNMGHQLGMATKLYQMKGKTLPAPAKENDWTQTVLISGGVAVLLSMIACCVIKIRNNKAAKYDEIVDIEDKQSLNINQSMDQSVEQEWKF